MTPLEPKIHTNAYDGIVNRLKFFLFVEYDVLVSLFSTVAMKFALKPQEKNIKQKISAYVFLPIIDRAAFEVAQFLTPSV